MIGSGVCPASREAEEFDPFEGAYQIDPAEALRWSREREPVFYSPKLGYWVVTRYDDVKAVFRNNLLFSPSIALERITPPPAEAQEILKRYGYAMDRTMVNEDEPAHMERRRLLLDSFAPETLAKHEPMIRELARKYMDRFVDKGRADLVAEMFWEIPLIVALHFLGVEGSDIDQLGEFCVAHTINTWGRPTKREQLTIADSVGRFWQAANRVLDKMMANPVGDGWMYFSIRKHLERPDIVPLSYLRSMMMAILVAAHETTSKAAANAFRMLLADRRIWDELVENPMLIPNAVEECLRFAGSVVAWRRIATAPAQIGGVSVPEGAKLLIVMASANRDERHFENPDSLDIYRDNVAEHLSFGYGAHQCMGKNIARMEMRIFLEEFIRRLPHLELVPEQEFKFLSNTSFRGPESLWVRWDPSRNPERKDSAVLRSSRSFKVGAPNRAGVTRKLRLSEVHSEADNINRFVFESIDGKPLPAWSAGAHLDLLVGNYERKYSLCGRRDDRSKYELAVLKEETGRGGSKFIQENLKIGDLVRVRGPKNHFPLDESADDYVLVAAGIGITPIIAMADRLKELCKTYQIHYAGRSFDTMAFLNRLKSDHGKVLHHYPSSEGRRLNICELVAASPKMAQIYACGPDRLLSELKVVSKVLPDYAVHIERFSAAGMPIDPSKERPFEIELRDSDLKLEVPAGRTVLDVLHSAGIDVACDCREGLCGSCEVQVLEGDIDHRDSVLSEDERTQNTRMMTCCSRAKGKKLVLSI